MNSFFIRIIHLHKYTLKRLLCVVKRHELSFKRERPDSYEPGLEYLWKTTIILRPLLPQQPLQPLQLVPLLQELLPLQEELP